MKPAAEFVHPLDADDTETTWNETAETSGTYRQLLKWSVIVGAIAFFVALIGSVIGNNAVGDPQLESLSTAMNRYGMLVLLLAAFCILIAVRGPKVMSTVSKWSAGKLRWSGWAVLLVFNLIGFAFLSLMLLALGVLAGPGPTAIWIVSCILPSAIGLMLIIALWHEGMVRAYAIGFLCSAIPLMMLGAVHSFVWTGWAFGQMGSPYQTYNGYSSNGFYNGFSLSIPFLLGFLGFAALSAFSGFVCATYVAVLERMRHRAAIAQLKADPNGTPSSVVE